MCIEEYYPWGRGGLPMGVISLVLGGVRSGKSAFAENLLAFRGSQSPAPLVYVALGPSPDGSDPEWDERVRRHRARREQAGAWMTWELDAAEEPLWKFLLEREAEASVLLDSLGIWVASLLSNVGQGDLRAGEEFVMGEMAKLIQALEERSGWTVVVAEEVGLSVHPQTELGRVFQDCMGSCTQALSRIAREAWLIVAGRPLSLGSL